MKQNMQFVQSPFLPEGKVCLCISALPVPGIKCICPPSVDCLPPSMRRHADLQVVHLGGRYVLCAPELYLFYKEALSPYGFEVFSGESSIGSTYPQDAAYTIARVGNVVFHNRKITDSVAKNFFENNGIESIHVRQGYAKCMCLPVDATSMITADKGIVKAAEKAGLSVLEIEPGGISLPGFSYGFLGGAAGKTDRNTLYVTGSLSKHPSRLEISAFLKNRGIKLKEGSIPIPIDIGSIIPLMEFRSGA